MRKINKINKVVEKSLKNKNKNKKQKNNNKNKLIKKP